MSNEINLVSRVAESRRRKGLASLAPPLLFGVVFLVAGSLLFYNFLLAQSISSLASQENQIIESLNSHPTQKSNALILLDRLKNISKALSARRDLNLKIASILTLLPPGVTVESLDATVQSITIKIVSKNLREIHDVLENKLQQTTRDTNLSLKNVDVLSSGIDKQRGYYVVLLFNF